MIYIFETSLCEFLYNNVSNYEIWRVTKEFTELPHYMQDFTPMTRFTLSLPPNQAHDRIVEALYSISHCVKVFAQYLTRTLNFDWVYFSSELSKKEWKVDYPIEQQRRECYNGRTTIQRYTLWSSNMCRCPGLCACL